MLFPGYVFLVALLPKRGNLDGVERLALSIGLSLAIAPLVGLVLNFTPWGLNTFALTLSLLVLVFCLAGVGLYRQRRLPREERFEPLVALLAVKLGTNRPLGDRVLSVALVLALLGTIAGVAYATGRHVKTSSFSEFYVVGPQGTVANYPTMLAPEEEGRVILGIVNHEREATTYRLATAINEARPEELTSVTLEVGRKWEQLVGFSFSIEAPDQQVRFLLYKGTDSEPYHTLRLWVDVEKK
jgi:uncharacterized membrane protein